MRKKAAGSVYSSLPSPRSTSARFAANSESEKRASSTSGCGSQTSRQGRSAAAAAAAGGAGAGDAGSSSLGAPASGPAVAPFAACCSP